MRHDLPIRVMLTGNPGNVAMMYLAAETLKDKLGFGEIHNVNIDMFGLRKPDIDLAGLSGLHFRERDESQTGGRLPFEAAISLCRHTTQAFIQIEGFCQNVENFPKRNRFDYHSVFPSPADGCSGGNEDEIVISIRGGEILRDIAHPHYVQVPIDFYSDIVSATKLRPVFFGQIGNNPYSEALRKRFPSATFKQGVSPELDFDYIRKSKNIIPSVSSFSWLAAYMSDANQIFMPLTGLFNPFQHRSSSYLLFGDERYKYFRFPFNYWINIDEYEKSHSPMYNRWEFANEERLRNLISHSPHAKRKLDDYMKFFDVDFYLETNAQLRPEHEAYGVCALYNHYLWNGFKEGAEPFFMDRSWYCRTYPEAAAALSRNEYFDEYHHFVACGAELGYRPCP